MTKCEQPVLFQSAIEAGFPSPADDVVEQELDLNAFLIKRPAATFFLRVRGDSMIKAGIHEGDILIVDRSLEPGDRKIVIASVNGELTVKRLSLKKQEVFLVAENDAFPAMRITPEQEMKIWGVVTTVIHPV